MKRNAINHVVVTDFKFFISFLTQYIMIQVSDCNNFLVWYVCLHLIPEMNYCQKFSLESFSLKNLLGDSSFLGIFLRTQFYLVHRNPRAGNHCSHTTEGAETISVQWLPTRI